MEIKDVQANQGNIDIVAVVTEKDEPRSFEKFGKQGKVCNAKIKDDSGIISLTLWNEDIDNVGVGDKIHVQNGWCSEFRDEKQLSAGKFGKIEIVEKREQDADQPKAPEQQPGEVLSNDPGVFGGGQSQLEGGEEGDEQPGEESMPSIDEEEIVG